jgi:hypothetical protein
MAKKTRNKDKNPHSDIPGGHAASRLRQMELERGLPDSNKDEADDSDQDEEGKQ